MIKFWTDEERAELIASGKLREYEIEVIEAASRIAQILQVRVISVCPGASFRWNCGGTDLNITSDVQIFALDKRLQEILGGNSGKESEKTE